MKQKVLKGLKIVTRWLACAKSALVLGVIVALITWGMPLATPKFVAKVNRLLSAFDGDTDVVSLMFSSVISFVVIFISALLVYIQVYINRFPSELVLNQIKPRYANFGTAIALYLFFCVVEMVVKMGRFSDAVLSVCGVGIFIWLFYFAYSLHYKTSLTECTRTYVKDILNTERLLEDSNALKAKLRILEKTYNECIARNELYVCQIICEESNKVFLESMKESQTSIINGDSKSKQISEAMDNTFEHSISLARDTEMTADRKTQTTAVRNVVSQLTMCIKLGMMDQYKKYTNMLMDELYFLCKSENGELQDRYYHALMEIVRISVESKNSQEYLKCTLTSMKSNAKYFGYLSNYDMSDGYLFLLGYCIEKDMGEEYIKDFVNFLKSATVVMPDFEKGNRSIEIVRNTIFMVLRRNRKAEVAIIIDSMDSIKRFAVKNEKWTIFSIQIFAEFENENFKDCFEISFEKHVNLLTSIKESYSDKFLSTLLYPDFKRFLNESENRIERVRILKDSFIQLMREAYRLDMARMSYRLFGKLQDCITDENITEATRESLMEIYFIVIEQSLKSTHEELNILIFSWMQEAIEALDQKKLLSENLGEEIINIIIDKITQTGMNEDVREYLLEMISGWSIQFEEGNPQNFVLINKQIRVLLINGLHSVGLFSLETLNIALLKNISNDLGWMLINALQQDYPEVQLLLDSVIDLYRKSVIFGVAFNIRIYLLTLFTTVGAFCQTDSKYNPTGDAVISFLKEIPHDMIDLAIDVRKNDYDGWDNDEFGNIKNGVAILKGKLAT